MTYDDLGRLERVQRDSVLDYEQRRYDAAGRMVYAKSHSSQSGVAAYDAWTDTRYNIYNAKAQSERSRAVGRYRTAKKTRLLNSLPRPLAKRCNLRVSLRASSATLEARRCL